MRQKALMTGFVIAIMTAGWAFASDRTDPVATDVTCRVTMAAAGKAIVSGRLDNPDTTARYRSRLFLFFGDLSEEVEGLSDIPPGSSREFQAAFDVSAWTPGVYTAVVMVDYESPTGLIHRTYHSVAATVNTPAETMPPPALKVGSESIHFNPKAFWRKNPSIRLALSNDHREPVTAIVTPYLKDGYHVDQGSSRLNIEPGAQHQLVLPLLDEKAKNSRFLIEVQYETGGFHYAHVVSGDILPLDRPVYFRHFLWVAALVLAGFFCLSVIDAKKNRRMLT